MKNIFFRNPTLKQLSSISIPIFFQLEEIPDSDFESDMDSLIHSTIVRLNQNQINSITIPLSLTENFLELSGLRLGHHIRLTNEIGYREVPLIFFGSMDQNSVLKLSPLASILSTPNVYYVDINKYSLVKIVESIKKIEPIQTFDFLRYLEFTRIEAPSNFQSHHSIANEWALSRYFSMLETDNSNEKYLKLREKVHHLDYLKTLHFKYIESNIERQKFNPKKHLYTPIIKNIKGTTIGIIDDEVEKGWGAFYDYLISKSDGNIALFDFYKDESKSDLIGRLKEWVEHEITSKCQIDIFIVDLRLHDEDFTEIDSEKLSGIQIIKHIKHLNKGIQVIISTASNKVWNFQNSIKYGVDSFIVKESPETLNSREETKNTLSNLSREIEVSSKRVFLADLKRRLEFMKEFNSFQFNKNENEFTDKVFGRNALLDQIFELLILSCFNDAILNQCLLLSFQIIENYCDLKSISDFGSGYSAGQKLTSGFIWKKDKTQFDIFVNKSNQEILTWFELKKGKFEFMDDSSNETQIGYNVFDRMKLKLSFQSGLDASSLVKMISVLHFREEIPQTDIERIMKLRYYRSNVAAHNTGKIKPNSYKISAKDDIVFLIGIFEKIFSNDLR